MKDRFFAIVMLACLLQLMTGVARAQEAKVVLLENSEDADRLHYPLLISNKRGYRIRCQTQADEDSVIRGLGVISVPGTVVSAGAPEIAEAKPLDNPLLCPSAKDSYLIKAFTFVGENGQEFYLQFPTAFGSNTYSNKVYRPGCTGLVEALKVKLEDAIEADPRPFVGDENIHEITCVKGGFTPPLPENFADWCAKPDLTDAERVTVTALLELTPGGLAALGNKPACTAAQTHLGAIKVLELPGKGITSLEPLASLIGLESLTLSNNQITDPGRLEKLVALTFLDLSRNKISNIAALSPMTLLAEADLSSNQIADLRPLASTRALTRLTLSNNQITDVSSLRFLQKLTALDLANNQLNAGALTPLLNLPELINLNLSNNRIESLETVDKFADKVDVNIQGNPVTAGFTDLCFQHRNEQTPLGQTLRAMLEATGTDKCPDATAALSSGPSLVLTNKQISDLQPLVFFKNLAAINLSGNAIIDISPLAEMTALTRLNLARNGIVEAEMLIGLPNLTTLDLTDNPLERSRFFGACYARPNLPPPQQAEILALLKFAAQEDCLSAVRILAQATSGVSLEKLELSSLDYFPVLQNVRRLDLRKNALSDAGPLRMLANLISLNVGGNRFTSLASIAALTNLEILDINGNQISSLEGIQALKKLQSLNLHGTDVSRISLLGELPNLKVGKVMLGGLTIAYSSFEDYCLVHKLDPTTLKDARPFMDAIKPLLAADGVDASNCKAVDAWAHRRAVLNLPNSRLVSIAPVRFFTGLRKLRLSGNRIRDVSPLAGLASLVTLNLSQNRIEDVRPLAGLTKLDLLDLRENRLNTLESVNDILQHKPSLDGNPVCIARAEGATTPLVECNITTEEQAAMVINVQTGKCLTIAGGVSTADNVPALQFDCDNHPSRRWIVFGTSSEAAQLENAQTGKCLAAAEGEPESNTPAVQFNCDDNPSRQWKLVENGGGTFRIQNAQTGKCLGIEGGVVANNVAALQFGCDGDLSRSWSIKNDE